MVNYLLLSDLLDLNRSFSVFNRPMYERRGYTYKEQDGNYILTINALGVEPSDINIEADYDDDGHNILKVSGKTLVDESEYKISYQFAFRKEIEEVSSKTTNGLLVLEIKFKEPVRPQIKITKNN